MTETELRVQLAKKLRWRYHEPKPPWAGYWSDPIGNPTELPSLYDLCLEGEERLTEEQQRSYEFQMAQSVMDDTGYAHRPTKYTIFNGELFKLIRLSNLPERAKVLIEVLP